MAAQYQVVVGDKGRVLNIDASWEPIDIILPSPVVDFSVTIKDINGVSATNNITVYGNTSDLIDGLSSHVISVAYDAVTFISDGVNWFRMSNFTGNSPTPAAGRGLFAGGNTGSFTAAIDYITIATTSNGTAFSNLTSTRDSGAGVGSSTRGVFGGGDTGGSPLTTMDYVTFANLVNAAAFGSLTVARDPLAACSSSTRGVWGGGNTVGDGGGSGNDSAVMDYITIATTGNAISFGNLSLARENLAACASPVRGVFLGGQTNVDNNNIDYITIATTGNAIAFGTLVTARRQHGACSNAIRGVTGGGQGAVNPVTTMEYITIANTANASAFGDLTTARRYVSACSSPIRGVWGGGLLAGGSTSAVIDYVIIATLANAVSFGNLTAARRMKQSCSNSHGGL